MVVVGGASAGVAAAVAAAEQGAKVFLAAPRPYLGEDLCATYRLWLEADEVLDDPLATELFTLPQSLEGIRYTYQADQPSAGKHQDTQPPGMLADGKWGTAFDESVQYNDEVTISIDFGTRQEIRKLHVMFFQGPRAYEVESMTFQASDDGQKWTPPLSVIDNDKLGEEAFVDSAIHLSREVAGSARYLKCFVKKTDDAERMLLGEILVEGPAQNDTPQGLRVTTPMQVKRTLDQALHESDMIDVWSACVVAKDKYRGAYDLGQLIDTRERRRIVGDYVLTPLDIVNRRTFPDTVGINNGGRLDKHGYTVHPYTGLGVIMAGEDRSLAMMRDAFRDPATPAEGKLRCAHVLGMLGDASGVETLIAKVRGTPEFDEERIDEYFPWVTWLDSYIIALGRTRDPRALEPLLEKLALLGQGSGSRVSHYRALALAFEALGDPAAAKPLGNAMQRLEIRGMAVTDTAGLTAQDRSKSGQSDLTLARVLYRLGNHEGIGKAILEQYARDVRGHYARHAQAVLKEGPLPRP